MIQNRSTGSTKGRWSLSNFPMERQNIIARTLKMFRFLFVHDSRKWLRIYVAKSRVVFYFTRERDAKNRFHDMQPDGATRTLPRAISWTTTKTYFCLNPQLSCINLYVGTAPVVNVERVPNSAEIQERGCTRREMSNRVHIFILI